MQLQKLPSYLITLAGMVMLGAVSFSANQQTYAFAIEQNLQQPLQKKLATQDRQLATYNSTWLAYTLYADPHGRVMKCNTK